VNNNGEEAGSNDSGIVEDSTLIAKNKKLQRRASMSMSTSTLVRVDVHEPPVSHRLRGSSADSRDRDDGFVDSTPAIKSNLVTLGKNRGMTASTTALASTARTRYLEDPHGSSSSATSSPIGGVTRAKGYPVRASDPNLLISESKVVLDASVLRKGTRAGDQTAQVDHQQTNGPYTATSTNSVIRSNSLYSHEFKSPATGRSLQGTKLQKAGSPTATATLPSVTRKLPSIPGKTHPNLGDHVHQNQPRSVPTLKKASNTERVRHASKSGGEQQDATTESKTLARVPHLGSQSMDSDMENCALVYEQVLELCLRLEREEERINKLTARIQREQAYQFSNTAPDDGNQDGESSDEEPGCEPVGGSPSRVLAESEAELRNIKHLSDNLNREIERNDRTMADMSLVLKDKQLYLDELQFQLIQAERDSDYLQDALDNFVLSTSASDPAVSTSNSSSPSSSTNSSPSGDQSNPRQPKGILKNKNAVVYNHPTARQRHLSGTPGGARMGAAGKGPCNGPGMNRDADSDTGLSSLHSSSDEAQYALDTLV
jgi:hypothetical protein